MAKCVACEAVFIPQKFYHGGAPHLQAYCSKACSSSRNASIASRASRNPVSRAKMGDTLRHTGKRTNYVKRNGRHEHRIVMEQVIGRTLRRDEIVHHKDGDKWNNAPSNLEILSRTEHARLHGLERGGINPKKQATPPSSTERNQEELWQS